MTINSLREALKSQRKFIVAMLSISGLLCLSAFGGLPADNFEGALIFCFGLYMGGNVGEHWTKRNND